MAIIEGKKVVKSADIFPGVVGRGFEESSEPGPSREICLHGWMFLIYLFSSAHV